MSVLKGMDMKKLLSVGVALLSMTIIPVSFASYAVYRFNKTESVPFASCPLKNFHPSQQPFTYDSSTHQFMGLPFHYGPHANEFSATIKGLGTLQLSVENATDPHQLVFTGFALTRQTKTGSKTVHCDQGRYVYDATAG
jgi:hypothetical protein